MVVASQLFNKTLKKNYFNYRSLVTVWCKHQIHMLKRGNLTTRQYMAIKRQLWD